MTCPVSSTHTCDCAETYAGELERLQAQAQDEGFLDVLLGSNCYTTSVREIVQDCNAMDADSSMWLAFSMANCLFAKTGRPVSYTHLTLPTILRV